MSVYKIEFDQIPWDTPMKGVRAKRFVHEGRQLRLVEYTPEMGPHWCENGHFGRVIEGTLEVKFDKETLVYGAGDGVFIPSGKAHRHMGRALTPIVRVIFVEDV